MLNSLEVTTDMQMRSRENTTVELGAYICPLTLSNSDKKKKNFILFFFFFSIKEEESLSLCEKVSLTSLQVPTVFISDTT